MRASWWALVAILAVGCAPAAPEAGTVQLTAADGLPVVADWHPAQGPPLGTIALFHQGGGDVRGEYERILPRLTEMGYHVLATDLRRGGDRFGMTNRTAPPGADTLYSYCDAQPDVHAAAQEARRYGDTPILWGSSFSAALVINEAAADPESVRAVLAFSPASGDPMEGCRPEAVSRGLDLPVLVMRPVREAQIPSVRAQLAEFEEQGHITHVADPGVHGSSMLDEIRVAASTEEAWRVVEAFLAGLAR